MDVLAALALDKIGFAFAGLANLAFFLLILVTRVKNLPRILLLCWSLTAVLWAGYYFLTAALPYSNAISLALELVRSLFLLLFLFTVLGSERQTLTSFVQSKAVLVTIVGISGWFLLCQAQLVSPHIVFTGSLALCILQLALIEALYRKAGENKWQYKPLVLSLGVCQLFDFVLLAESALFGQVDAQLWAARGFVYGAMVPFIVIAVRRITAWGISIYVSRDIVLQSSLVLAAGIYLCLIAVAGFYIRYIGGNWSNLLQTTFFVLGFAMLALLLLSGAVRRRLKVFIEKHFFANKYDYRLKWLELTQQLQQVDISKAEQYNIIMQAWLNAVGYNRGCLIKVNSNTNLSTLARINRMALTQSETELINHYVDTFAGKKWIIDLTDYDDSFARQYRNLPTIDIQLIIPIHADDKLWGLCLINTPDIDKQHLNWELRDYLMLVTEQISSYLMLIQASQILSENAQFAAFSRMSAFVVHDLKNVKAQIDLIISNSKKHKDNPEFINDVFETLDAMQSRLQNMLSQLNSKRNYSEHASIFNVAELINQVIKTRCAAKQPIPVLDVISDVELSLDKERLSSVLYHLIDNAQHATSDKGTVNVTLRTVENNVVIVITDTGCGMTEEFINQRLFKPFDSTKGNSGMGVGAYDALHFAEQHNGQLSVKSKVGHGTTFTLKLPLH